MEAGAATGFVGLFAYLGASLAGWPLAKVLDTWHWSGFFVVISIAAGISALLLLPFLVGNYSEIFERNVGSESPLKIKRGQNNLWNNGGIQYAPPVR